MERYKLKLYVTGKTSRSERAIENLRSICREAFDGAYDLEVVDVLESPQDAEENKILATPTLVKSLPPPMRRIIGDLSERDKVLVALDLHKTREDERDG